MIILADNGNHVHTIANITSIGLALIFKSAILTGNFYKYAKESRITYRRLSNTSL